MRRVLVSGLSALLLAGCSFGAQSSPSPTVTSPPPHPPASVTTPGAGSTSRSAAPRSSVTARPSAPASSTPRTVPKATRHPSTAVHAGTVVVLDPGHNGGNAQHPAELNRQVPMGFGQTKPCNTTGTSTNAGYAEHAFNFDVAERTRSILQAHGVTVYLTRPNDIGFGPCVNERADFGNRMHAAAVVAIHADGASSSGTGFHVSTASRQPVGATSTTMADSHDMAVDIHDALLRTSGLGQSSYIGSNGYFPRSDLAGLNLTVRPMTFLELGNMRNNHDAGLQSSPSGRQQIAAAVAAGILSYLANP